MERMSGVFLGDLIIGNIVALSTLPDQILEADREVRKAIEVEKLANKLQDIVIEIEFDVAIDTDENKKPKFSNADKRKAEVRRRQREHKTYRAIDTELNKLKLQLSFKEAELSALQKKLGAQKALAGLLSGICRNGYISGKLFDTAIAMPQGGEKKNVKTKKQ